MQVIHLLLMHEAALHSISDTSGEFEQFQQCKIISAWLHLWSEEHQVETRLCIVFLCMAWFSFPQVVMTW
jgi:hypothetical protein